MDVPRKLPRRNDDRIILHFDYDCFYAQVVENQQPSLRGLPLGIRQKSILATCNYAARKRGVRKLMLASEARKICPELVLADGEDLTAFRDVSKRLYALLRGYVWGSRAERLGLDEVFVDATDMVDYNVALINHRAPDQAFFQLSEIDPERGFPFDASAVAGCVCGANLVEISALDNPLALRLVVASHLARYLRLRIEEAGYTASAGIATSKLLSKLAGSCNKPRNQTTLLGLSDADVHAFMDPHRLRQVPGIGARTTRLLEGYVLASKPDEAQRDTADCVLTVGETRISPFVSAPQLEKVLAGPGAEKGVGERVWNLLHGVDNSPVKAASDIPTQISIEDTYQGLRTLAEITRELHKLTASLLRRMHVDLVEEANEGRKWLARPRTLRLATRPKTSAAEGKPYNFQRASRSQPLPAFIFSLSAPADQIVDRLVAECLLPMFHHLNPDSRIWNIGLINICVANMVLSGTDDRTASGRDISAMFRRQEDVLREFTLYDDGPPDEDGGGREDVLPDEAPFRDADQDDALDEWDDSDAADTFEACPTCGHSIPGFAIVAHHRYHVLGD